MWRMIFFVVAFMSFQLCAEAKITMLHGTVDFAMVHQVKRVLTNTDSSDLVVFRINTNGGRLDAALEIADAIFSSNATTVAFVEQKALSAGALISLACDSLVMVRGSTIGDCAPISAESTDAEILGEKVQSPIRAKFRLFAEKSGYPIVLAEAMVMPELEILRIQTADTTLFVDRAHLPYLKMTNSLKADTTLVVKAGELLTLSDAEAFRFGFSKATVANFEEYQNNTPQLKNALEIPRTWSERFIALIGTFAPVLTMLGIAALFIESRIPGFGFFGFFGAVALVIVFAAQHIAGLAGYTELFLLILGGVLLVIEVFVIPGFGVAGVMGIVALSGAMFLSLQGFTLPDPALPWEGIIFRDNLRLILYAFLGAVILIVGFFVLVFPRFSRLQSGSILSTTLTERILSLPEDLVGKLGIVKKDCRPVGEILIDGEVYGAVSVMGFIEKGAEVVVVQCQAHELKIRLAETKIEENV